MTSADASPESALASLAVTTDDSKSSLVEFEFPGILASGNYVLMAVSSGGTIVATQEVSVTSDAGIGVTPEDPTDDDAGDENPAGDLALTGQSGWSLLLAGLLLTLLGATAFGIRLRKRTR